MCCYADFTDRKPRLKVANTLAKVTEMINVIHCLYSCQEKIGKYFQMVDTFIEMENENMVARDQGR